MSAPHPCQQLNQMITSLLFTRAIYIAAKLRIADQPEGGPSDGRGVGRYGRRGGPAAVPGPESSARTGLQASHDEAGTGHENSRKNSCTSAFA